MSVIALLREEVWILMMDVIPFPTYRLDVQMLLARKPQALRDFAAKEIS